MFPRSPSFPPKKNTRTQIHGRRPRIFLDLKYPRPNPPPPGSEFIRGGSWGWGGEEGMELGEGREEGKEERLVSTAFWKKKI